MNLAVHQTNPLRHRFSRCRTGRVSRPRFLSPLVWILPSLFTMGAPDRYLSQMCSRISSFPRSILFLFYYLCCCHLHQKRPLLTLRPHWFRAQGRVAVRREGLLCPSGSGPHSVSTYRGPSAMIVDVYSRSSYSVPSLQRSVYRAVYAKPRRAGCATENSNREHDGHSIGRGTKGNCKIRVPLRIALSRQGSNTRTLVNCSAKRFRGKMRIISACTVLCVKIRSFLSLGQSWSSSLET